MKTNKYYLGDSVYADVENGMIKLTTENDSEGPSNTIYEAKARDLAEQKIADEEVNYYDFFEYSHTLDNKTNKIKQIKNYGN